MNLNKSKYILAATIMTGSFGINLNAEITDPSQCMEEVSQDCENGASTWNDNGEAVQIITGQKDKEGRYIVDYKQNQVNETGAKRLIRTDYLVEVYDEKGTLTQKEDWNYDLDGNYIGKTVTNYRVHKQTKKDVLTRTREYDLNGLVSDEKVAIKWENKGIKKFTTGTAKSKNGTYIADYKELSVSNFGDEKYKRTDYRVYKYDKNGNTIAYEDWGYDKNGKYVERKIYDYRYNTITKKSVISRTRDYKNGKLVSDKKVATSWENSGSKKKYTTGKKNKANSTYIEDYKQPQTSNFGQKRTIRVDYKVWKYNKYKQVIQDENWNYDKNGGYTTKTVKNYYYNSITKKSVNTRIRTYSKSKLTSDLRKNQLKRPTRKGTITNEFNGVDLTYSNGHKGIDIAAPTGTPIYPVISGRIIEISYDRVGGNKVVLHHKINGIDYVTYYGHMSKLTRNYKVGDVVDVNDKIGSMGSSGLSTGSHVHFELMVGTSKKDHRKAVNPRTYIDFPKLWKSY